MIMQDVMCLVFVRIFWTRITFVLSPGLSPIEQLWDEIGRRARHHQNSPKTLQELRDALVHEWNNIPEAFIKRLIGSIRRRCEAVVAARGGHTRYWTPQTSILHDNFCLSMICSDNNVDKFCWYCLICHAHVYLNYTIFVEFFSLCTKYWAWISCIVFFCWLVYILITNIKSYRGRRGRDGRMVVWFTTTCSIKSIWPLQLLFQIPLMARCTQVNIIWYSLSVHYVAFQYFYIERSH
jgi:hypothetical protein